MSWRNHNNHREETKAVKDALVEAGIPVLKVGHGTGTAWGWLEIHLPPPDETKHEKMTDTDTPWICYANCSECQKFQDLRNEAIRVALKVTGRKGEYDGRINVYAQ